MRGVTTLTELVKSLNSDNSMRPSKLPGRPEKLSVSSVSSCSISNGHGLGLRISNF